MQSKDNFETIKQIIEQEINLPSPPVIAVQILRTVQQDDIALAKLGEIISADPALTAKMLKVANSAIFPGNIEVTNINRAMAILGTDIIKNIALSFVITNQFKQGTHCFDFDLFWRRSVTSAVAAELLSQVMNCSNDDLFVSALLQDIGMLVISLTKGDEYAALLHEVEITAGDLLQLENSKFGFNHQQVGYALLESWNFPALICEPVLCHHQPEDAAETCRPLARTVYYANLLAEVYTEGNERAENARIIQEILTEQFDVSEADAAKLLDDVALRSSELLETFDLAPGEIKPYSVLLQEANKELGKLYLSNEQLILELRDAKQKTEEMADNLREANERLKELVYRDGLTGLYNHRYFQESMDNEMARAIRYHSSISLILFDIDFFKKVNDTYGHPAGDLVLMNIAKAVTQAVRPCDIVARYGGEEFAVILPETGAAGAKVFAARLRRCIEGIATLIDGQMIYVTVSAGATTFKQDSRGITKSMLIEAANRGLYASKKNGRNQVTIVDPETLSVTTTAVNL